MLCNQACSWRSSLNLSSPVCPKRAKVCLPSARATALSISRNCLRVFLLEVEGIIVYREKKGFLIRITNKNKGYKENMEN